MEELEQQVSIGMDVLDSHVSHAHDFDLWVGLFGRKQRCQVLLGYGGPRNDYQ